MKPRAIYYIAAGLALALTISVCDGLRYKDKTSVLIGREQEATAALQVVNAEAVKEKAALQAVIAERDKRLVTSAQVIGQMTTAIGQAQAGEAAASAESAKLKAEVQPVIDANPKLKAFILSLESRLTQKDGIIAGQATVILQLGVPTLTGYENGVPVFSYPEGSVTHSLNAQRIAEKGIAAGFEKQLRQTEALLTIRTALNKSLTRKVKISGIVGNLKTGAILGLLGAYVVYDKLKGK